MGTAVGPTKIPYMVVNMDPDGDLLLGTKPEQKGYWKFRVCSATLRRHSPVWKTMLFGPWKEAKPVDNSEWVVELPEDPAFEMQTALYIIHGLVDQVPEHLSVDNLFKLLILLNKHDMTRIVKPWCAQWMLPAEQSLLAPSLPKSLYIAWELGNESLFTARLAEIAMETQMEGNVLVFKHSDTSAHHVQGINLEAEDYLGPPDILDLISKIRKAVIKRMTVPLNENLEARVKSTPCCTQGASWDPTIRSLCDAAILGSIYRGMIKRQGSILPKDSSCITESVVQLASWLFPIMAGIQTPHHNQQCSLKDKYSKHNVTLQASIPDIVQKSLKSTHKEYMASQGSKTGLASQPGTNLKFAQCCWKLT